MAIISKSAGVRTDDKKSDHTNYTQKTSPKIITQSQLAFGLRTN